MQREVSYGEAMRRKYPEPIVIAISRDSEGKYNPITLGWFMPTSHEPPMVAISVAFARHSYGAIRGSGCFVVSFPSEHMKEETLFFGTKSGKELDKLAAMKTKIQQAKMIDSVLLEDAVVNLECILKAELTTGDHAIFVGQVVTAHVNADAALRRLYTVDSHYGMSAVRPV